jgi:hypothetical protein
MSSSSSSSQNMSAEVLHNYNSQNSNTTIASSSSSSSATNTVIQNKRKQEHILRSLNFVHFDGIVGSGTFGVVYKAVEKETKDRVALKKIKMERETQGFPITVSFT